MARSRRRPSFRTFVASALAVALGLAAAGFVASPAYAVPLLTESFAENTVASPDWRTGGSYTPCLTVPGGSGTVPTTCADPADVIDTAGSGKLRLTDRDGSLAGYTLYNSPLPTRAGLDISFSQYQWGGTGADGINFFLTDGSYELLQAGPPGGALGYNAKSTATPGLAHGLLGVGLDAFGNYASEYNSAECAIRPTFSPDHLGIRGPAGDVTAPAGSGTGYCHLATPVAVPGGWDTAGATSRPGAKTVRIVIDPPAGASPQVTVFVDGAQLIQAPLPAVFLTTPTFKFGFAASTGGSNNNHEIGLLTVSSVDPIAPGYTISSPATVGPALAGATATVPFTVSLDPEDGPGSAGNPVTVQVSIPAGSSFAGTPSGTGWTCPAPAPSALTVSCTYTPDASTISGTDLPVLQVPVTKPTGGSIAVSGAVSSADNVNAASSSTTNVAFEPGAPAVSASGPAADAAPAAIVTASPGVAGSPVYALTTPPTPAQGTATIDPATGVITFTPAPGTSGQVDLAYSATVGGQTSTGPATIRVVPVAADGTAATVVDDAVDVDLATLTAGDGLSFQLVQPPTSVGAVTVTAAGLATFTPASGYSGPAVFTYTATDPVGNLVSNSATVRIAVAPTAPPLAASGALDAAGAATLATPAPTAVGTGPFTYEIVGQPTDGTVTIDAATGAITYVAETGVSGTFTATYRALDSSGIPSAPATATFTVAPFAAGISAVTVVNVPVTLPAPTAEGTGPFTWRIASGPATGSATIDPATGVVTFTPGSDLSGIETLELVAQDGNGVDSAPVAATVSVRPAAEPVGGSAVASASPTAVDIPADGTGTALTYSVGAPSDGTATVVGGSIRITPPPGFSGVITVPYTARDDDGLASAPATATLTVSPVAADAAITVASGGTGTLGLPNPVGSGPFTWEVTTPLPAGVGTASIDPATGLLTVTADPGYSGPATIEYRVVDGDGIPSAVRTITVTVAPAVDPGAATIPATQPGGPASVARVPLNPRGSGPFGYTITTPPPTSAGTATVDPATGEVVFTAAPGFSGVVDIPVTATDANGATAGAVARVTVNPVASVAPGARSGVQGVMQIFVPPTPIGTGPFTFVLDGSIPASQGTVEIDPVTGAITFRPAPGFTGVATIRYAVIDANGLRSAPAEVRFTVTAAAGAGGGLAATGTSAAPPVGIAALLLLFGATLLALHRIRRRRRA